MTQLAHCVTSLGTRSNLHWARRWPCSLRQAWARVASAHASDAETAHKGDRINHLLARRVQPEAGACPGAPRRWVSDEVLRTATCAQAAGCPKKNEGELRQCRARGSGTATHLTHGAGSASPCIHSSMERLNVADGIPALKAQVPFLKKTRRDRIFCRYA